MRRARADALRVPRARADALRGKLAVSRVDRCARGSFGFPGRGAVIHIEARWLLMRDTPHVRSAAPSPRWNYAWCIDPVRPRLLKTMSLQIFIETISCANSSKPGSVRQPWTWGTQIYDRSGGQMQGLSAEPCLRQFDCLKEDSEKGWSRFREGLGKEKKNFGVSGAKGRGLSRF